LQLDELAAGALGFIPVVTGKMTRSLMSWSGSNTTSISSPIVLTPDVPPIK
jgi:hypothetical protein